MIHFRTLTMLFFLVSQIAVGFAQQWPVEIIKRNLVGAWIRTGDFDNDADQDLIIQNGDTLFWQENLKPGWSEHIIDTEFLNSEFAWLEVLDMDLDGDLDLLQSPSSSPTTIAWNENRNNGVQWQKHVISRSIDRLKTCPNPMAILMEMMILI